MKCWICGDEGNSGEHLIKASDLKALFVRETKNVSLYLHTDRKRNNLIGGLKARKLKSKALLCGYCNSHRTKVHDEAWRMLSAYLRERQPPIRPGMSLRLNRVFPGGVRKSMLSVHLFFVKLFGCRIVEHNIPIKIGQFSKSIMVNVPHPKVWLAFSSGLHHPSIKHAGYTQIVTDQSSGHINFASWFYVIDKVAVNVMYSEPGEHRKGLVHAWHPSCVGKRIHVV